MSVGYSVGTSGKNFSPKESFWEFKEQDSVELNQSMGGWRNSADVSVKNPFGRGATGYRSIAQSFIARSAQISAVEICMYSVGKAEGWLRLDLTEAQHERPGRVIGRSWIRIDADCPVPHGEYMIFPIGDVSVERGKTYWIALSSFIDRRFLDNPETMDLNLTNIMFSSENNFPDGQILSNGARGRRELEAKRDLKFQIVSYALPVPFLIGASHEKLKTLPSTKFREAEWLHAYDDWMEPYDPRIKYERIMHADSPSVDQLLVALDLPGADKSEVLARVGELKKAAVPAVPKLVSLLEDPSFMIRLRAVQALGLIGGKDAASAVPVLVRMLNQEEHFTEFVVETLGLIGSEARASIPKLVELLRDGEFHNRHVRFRAAVALCQIDLKEPNVRKALIETVKKNGDFARMIANYLSHEVPATDEWIQTFLELYESNHIPLQVLHGIYHNASQEGKGRFPPELVELRYQ